MNFMFEYNVVSNHLKPGAHLAWKEGVCHGRAAFDITFQHKTTFSFNIVKRRLRTLRFFLRQKWP